jgi:hypothetical protein
MPKFPFIQRLFLGFNFFLLWSINSFGQKTFDILPDVGGIDEQGQGWTLLADSNEFYVLGDLLDTSINGFHTILPWIGTFDYSGEMLSRHWIIDTTAENPIRVARNSIAKDSNGNILIYGSQRLSGCCIKPKLIVADPQTGAILESVYLTNPIDSSLGMTRKIMLLEDSLFVLSSYMWIDNHYKFYVAFLDQAMDVSSSFILSDTEYNNIVYYLEMDSDSTLIIIGDTRLASDNSNFPEVKPFFMRVSKNGIILEHTVLSGMDEKTLIFGLAYTNTVQRDEYNNWIISCLNLIETNLCETCHYLVPYTLSVTADFGSINWITKFASFSPKQNEQPAVTSMVKCSDNSGFITSGFDGYSFLYKVNNNGDSVWLKKYIPLGWNDERALWTEFVDLKATLFGTYLLTGRVSDNELNIIRPWILHIDSVGCLVPGCDSKVGLIESGSPEVDYFSIYPNPSTDQLYISNRHKGPLDCEISLRSITGQILMNSSFNSNPNEEYILPLTDLPPGIYIVSIFEKGRGLIVSERVIIE